MTIKKNNLNQTENTDTRVNSLENSTRWLADLTRKEIEKTYNINNIHGTETYYSNRYGWVLRKIVS